MEKVKSILWYSREPRTALVAMTNDADDDDDDDDDDDGDGDGDDGGAKEKIACN